jgi:hypothetical protein
MIVKLINQVAPPALPLARGDYERTYQDQLNNVLRLYFRQLASTLNSLVGSTGGRFLQTPYAAIQRTTAKTFTANTATQITFDQNDYLNGCTNDGTDGITVEYNGLYNYQFSVQLKNTDSQAHTAWIWLRKNTTNVLGAASQVSVPSKHGSTDGHVIVAANFYVNLVAGDYVALYAAVDNVLVSMKAYPVQTSPFSMPAIPSVVATLSFVSSYEA